MAQVSSSLATLRIMGDDLNPEEVSRLVCCEPTKSEFKGQKIVAKKSGRVRIARGGSWRLTAQDRAPEDLDGQVSELLRKLTDDLSVWDHLAERFVIDLFVGLFLDVTNEGMVVSPQTLRQLGERGISLGLDVYCPLNPRSDGDG